MEQILALLLLTAFFSVCFSCFVVSKFNTLKADYINALKAYETLYNNYKKKDILLQYQGRILKEIQISYTREISREEIDGILGEIENEE